MSNTQLTFLGQDFIYEKSEENWELRLKRSDVATQDMDYLRLLDLHHPMFLKQEMSFDDDIIQFTYHLEEKGLDLAAIKKRPLSERIRLALNVLDLEQCLQLPVTFFLHPNNLFVTKDECVKIAYRAVPNIMTPSSIDSEEFLLQAKCFIITIFTEYQFSTLYEGALDVVEVPRFLDDIRKLTSIQEVRESLTSYYHEKCEEESAKLVIVKKNSYKLYKYSSIWLTISIVLLLAPLIYLIFIHNPFKEKMLDADTSFIKVDYSAVIKKLKNVDVNELPYTQKYELAYSYIKNLNFSHDKEEVIMNNITLKTEDLYLEYWIEIGRGKADKALDIAKRLDDSDLILYAIAQEIKNVRDDSSLSGSDRDSQLDKLQSEYDKYWKDRTDALAELSSTDSSSENETDSSKNSSTSTTSSSN
ncbi:MAG: type VII secretion protein EssB [Streptococcus sp.]|nr:type VII secretion protein EssB [Streptococcus sp.]